MGLSAGNFAPRAHTETCQSRIVFPAVPGAPPSPSRSLLSPHTRTDFRAVAEAARLAQVRGGVEGCGPLRCGELQTAWLPSLVDADRFECVQPVAVRAACRAVQDDMHTAQAAVSAETSRSFLHGRNAPSFAKGVKNLFLS